jgi:hypothetical protein
VFSSSTTAAIALSHSFDMRAVRSSGTSLLYVVIARAFGFGRGGETALTASGSNEADHHAADTSTSESSTKYRTGLQVQPH